MTTQLNYRALANDLKDVLGLATSPVAINFRSQRPANVPAFGSTYPEPTPDGRTGAVPAGCCFWGEGTRRTFSTVAEDHGNCSVGGVTHGFKSLSDVADKQDVRALCETGWVTPEAVGGIATVKEKPAAIVYGPLEEASEEPSVVLFWLSGKQQMFFHDAWPQMRLEGKPQCHIIAIAKENKEVAMSVGCMLSRVRTGMSNNEVTCAVPGAILPELLARLQKARVADDKVAAYAAQDAKRFARATS